MTAPNERDDEILRSLFASGVEKHQLDDQEFSEALAAYQKVEGLFDLLRRPANAIETQPDDDLAPGSMLGEFAVLRRLATGGMGQVYLARQESLGRLVALKVCKPDMAHDARLKTRFLAEGRSLAQLAHPNVVPVLSTGEHQGYLYLAMEYIAGPTLAKVLEAIQAAPPDALASSVVASVLASPPQDSQGQPWKEGHARLDRGYQTWVIQTIQQVAQGLAAAHAAGILHRDIKPANIVFAADGVPKIVDFGLARTTRGPSTTVAGEFYGTPSYTSPEQAHGDAEAVSPASDVFSLGVTLFECLCLVRPFPGRTSAEVLSAVLNSDPPLLRRVEKSIPWELEAITDKCLRKNPFERYPTAKALADDLRNYLELRPIIAKPASALTRAGRRIRRRPLAAAFFVTLLIALILGGIFARRAWLDYQSQRQEKFARYVDSGDTALYRCLTAQRPTWLPSVMESFRREGIDAYSAALDMNPSAVWPLVQRGRLYAAKRETLPLALADFDQAEILQPSYTSIPKFRSRVLSELDRKDEAQKALDKSKELNPVAVEDFYWLGDIAGKDHDFGAAHLYFSQALLLAPSHYWSRLDRVLWGRSPTFHYASQADTERRIQECEIAKSLRPDLPFASEFIVQYARAWKEYAPAWKKELLEQIDRFGLDVLRAHDMSDLLRDERRYGEAEDFLRKVLEQDTAGVTADKLGDLKYWQRDYKEAEHWYQRAIKENHKYALLYVKLANSFTARKDYAGAEKAYLDGVKQLPNDPVLLQDFGRWYEGRGRPADAESIYRKGCELPLSVERVSGPTDNTGHVRHCYQSYANLLAKAERREEATSLLEQAIQRLESGGSNQGVLAAHGYVGAHPSNEENFVEQDICGLKELLGQQYIYAGRRNDVLALIEKESQNKPLSVARGGMIERLLGQLGASQDALEVARVTEFGCRDDGDRLAASSGVNLRLKALGMRRELVSRIETKRALKEELSESNYQELGSWYHGDRGLRILEEGVKQHPEAFGVWTDFMIALARNGKKKEARAAYETATKLFFEWLRREETPRPVGDFEGFSRVLWPGSVATFWFTYLLEHGSDQEVDDLEKRLRAAWQRTGKNPDDVVVGRASAEFAARRYTDAVKSLKFCLQKKLWNEIATEAIITAGLARSLRAVGRRKDAIESYRRAVQLSAADPGLLSEFLSLVVQEQGVDGLSRELPSFEQTWLKLNVRPNATLDCFSAWAALVTGDQKRAFEKLVSAGPFFLQASRQTDFAGDEALACGVILQIVSEKLADSKRMAEATEFLKRFPADRAKAMRKVFSLPG